MVHKILGRSVATAFLESPPPTLIKKRAWSIMVESVLVKKHERLDEFVVLEWTRRCIFDEDCYLEPNAKAKGNRITRARISKLVELFICGDRCLQDPEASEVGRWRPHVRVLKGLCLLPRLQSREVKKLTKAVFDQDSVSEISILSLFSTAIHGWNWVRDVETIDSNIFRIFLIPGYRMRVPSTLFTVTGMILLTQ